MKSGLELVAAALGLSLLVSTAGAEEIKVAGSESLSIGSWGRLLPDANEFACPSPAKLREYNEIIARMLQSLNDPTMTFPGKPRPKGCTTLLGGSRVQLIQAQDDFVCVREHDADEACLWIMKLSVESETAFDRDERETKEIREKADEAFDRVHPECKDWRTNKNLPKRCY